MLIAALSIIAFALGSASPPTTAKTAVSKPADAPKIVTVPAAVSTTELVTVNHIFERSENVAKTAIAKTGATAAINYAERAASSERLKGEKQNHRTDRVSIRTYEPDIELQPPPSKNKTATETAKYGLPLRC